MGRTLSPKYRLFGCLADLAQPWHLPNSLGSLPTANPSNPFGFGGLGFLRTATLWPQPAAGPWAFVLYLFRDSPSAGLIHARTIGPSIASPHHGLGRRNRDPRISLGSSQYGRARQRPNCAGHTHR
jgi:hypothetical protein